jgi:hypothetical protein
VWARVAPQPDEAVGGEQAGVPAPLEAWDSRISAKSERGAGGMGKLFQTYVAAGGTGSGVGDGDAHRPDLLPHSTGETRQCGGLVLLMTRKTWAVRFRGDSPSGRQPTDMQDST